MLREGQEIAKDRFFYFRTEFKLREARF
jgi:hypothetical protein